MPKALLVHATDPDLELAEQPSTPFPVLGVTTLAALFPEEWDVDIIDEDFQKIDKVREADLVGISTLTINAPHAYKRADELRERGIPVIMGGMHPSALPEEALEHCDAVVVGEAEGVFTRVLDDFSKGNMSGVYRGELVDLSRAPRARFDLLPAFYRDYIINS